MDVFLCSFLNAPINKLKGEAGGTTWWQQEMEKRAPEIKATPIVPSYTPF
jgi:hypothetical protein